MPVFRSYGIDPNASCAVNKLGVIEFDRAAGALRRIPCSPTHPSRVVQDGLIDIFKGMITGKEAAGDENQA